LARKRAGAGTTFDLRRWFADASGIPNVNAPKPDVLNTGSP